MRVMIDACVLFPTVMREVILGCAKQGLFEPRWSPRILEEWARAAGKIGPAQETWARGEIVQVTAVFPKSNVTYPSEMDRQYWLPDPADVHVLAAAVHGSCDAILTMNAKDFPGNLLAEEGLYRASPDPFLLSLLEEAPEPVRAVADAVLSEANRLSPEPWQMRALMKKARLPRFGKALVA